MKPVNYEYADKARFKFNPETMATANEEPSLTVQGEALSIQQLFQRAAAGMDLSLKGDAYYVDELIDDIDAMYNPSNYDLTDMTHLSERIEYLSAKIENDLAEAERKASQPEPEPKPESEVE